MFQAIISNSRNKMDGEQAKLCVDYGTLELQTRPSYFLSTCIYQRLWDFREDKEQRAQQLKYERSAVKW
ncbi:hypothetical protein BT69DRAFT_261561 [Atractiella rhizophila]|nr:hypothetical protein BT69DRAFT_261561 [Atractiella rhizophila]